MTLSVRTEVQISLFYDFFFSYPMLSISFITCQALWDHEGFCPFFVCLFRLKEHEKGWKWRVQMPLPRRPLIPGRHRTSIPSSALCLASSASFQFPKPSGRKACVFLSGCNHLTFVYLLSRPRCVFINRLLYFNVSNVKGLNYQYLHIQSLAFW